MTLALDHDLLAQTSRVLLRHDLALRAEAPPEPPDTGSSSAVTVKGLDILDARVRSVGAQTHALADALRGRCRAHAGPTHARRSCGRSSRVRHPERDGGAR